MLNLLLFNTVLDIKIKKEKNKKKKKNKKNYNQLFKHEKLMFILDCQALAFYNKLKKRKYKNKRKYKRYFIYICYKLFVRSFVRLSLPFILIFIFYLLSYNILHFFVNNFSSISAIQIPILEKLFTNLI